MHARGIDPLEPAGCHGAVALLEEDVGAPARAVLDEHADLRTIA